MYPYARYSKIRSGPQINIKETTSGSSHDSLQVIKSWLVHYMQLQLDQTREILGSSGLEVDLQVDKGMSARV